MRRWRYIIYSLILLSYATAPLAAGENTFAHLGVQQGLTAGSINSFTKDSQGFLWISTSGGLNRYDGHTIRTFTHNPHNPYSIPKNNIHSIQEDDNGLFWVSTVGMGIYYFDPIKEQFHPIKTLAREEYGIKDNINLVFIDKEKNTWLHTYDKLYLHHHKTDQTTLLPSPLPQNRLDNIVQCNDNIALIYRNATIIELDPTTGETRSNTPFTIEGKNLKNLTKHLFVDSHNNYWVYEYHSTALYLYLAKEKRWHELNNTPTSKYRISNNNIKDIEQHPNGEIWIATDHGGINVINLDKEQVRYITNSPNDPRSISQNSIYSLYHDNTGIMWVGTHKEGISYHSPRLYKFRTDPLSQFNADPLFTPDINVLAEDPNGGLWLGSNGHGLLYMNPATETYRPLGKGDPKHNKDIITALMIDDQQNVWFGTFLNGLNRYDGKRFTSHPGPKKKHYNNIWALAPEKEGRIWVGTLGKGLLLFDPADGSFTPHYGENNKYANHCIVSIHTGRDGSLYMATDFGLVIYDPATEQYRKLQSKYDHWINIEHSELLEVLEDQRGLIWLTTMRGMTIYDPTADEIYQFEDHPLLGEEIICNIIEEGRNSIWVTTTNHIIEINIAWDEESNRYKFDTFTYESTDGIDNQLFNSRATLKTSDGEILFAGSKGITHKNQLPPPTAHPNPQVIFTDLKLYNNTVEIDSAYTKQAILTQAINHTKRINLDYDQTMFTISFSAMQYIAPEKTDYYYRLDKIDPQWIKVEGHRTSFTNLAPGNYTMQVKAINIESQQTDTPAEIEISIAPPIWLTRWAYALYTLILIAFIIWVRHLIRRKMRTQFEIQQMQREQAHIVEMNEMRLRFFTNISHELRTPLSLIITPIEAIIKESPNDPQRPRLEMIQRNTTRLLNMVNQLLDFRKSYSNELRLNLNLGDIIGYIQTTFNTFTDYAQRKGVHLTFFSSIESLIAPFDKDKVGTIINNLLSNALKFTPENGRIDLALNCHTTPNDTNDKTVTLEIRVADSGIGINDQDKAKIFDRFYQIDNDRTGGGSGIGLHLVKEFAELHNGSVHTIDNAPQGTIFIIELRLNQAEATTQTPPPHTLDQLTDEDPDDSATDPSIVNQTSIMIIDDNEDIRTLVRSILGTDYHIIEAGDGQEAWQIIQSQTPDIIISDVMMPHLDGHTLCRRIKDDIRFSHIPLMLLTARSTHEQEIKGLESGADDYLTKPFSLEIFTLKVTRLHKMILSRQACFTTDKEINPSEINITSLDEKLLRQAMDIVEQHISDSEFSVAQMSKEMGMSRVYLYKKLSAISGKSPIEFIRIIRLKRAAQLLRESQLNISEIAYEVGFNTPRNFSKLFKAEFGVLPSAYPPTETTPETTPEK